MVAEEDQSAGLVLVMMRPKVIYGIVIHARDGGDLGKYVLTHQGVPDAEILIDIAAVRHAFHGAGKGGERVDPVTELIGWKGPDIPIADTRLEIEMLLAHFASSKKKRVGQIHRRCYPHRPSTRTALPEREGPPSDRGETKKALDMLAAAGPIGRHVGTGRFLGRRNYVSWAVLSIAPLFDIGNGLSDDGKTMVSKCAKATSQDITT